MPVNETLAAVGEWLRIKGQTQLAADLDHSALIYRLLDHCEIFKTPPPVFYSTPWYRLLDLKDVDLSEHDVHIPANQAMFKVPVISVGQSMWEIIDGAGREQVWVIRSTRGHVCRLHKIPTGWHIEFWYLDPQSAT